ncbi:MAG: Flp pilus assembly complex ATPase component TadA [Candidatus Aenigmarchaeota archaeon]|nr:Flp pilus assembly complex ATPase component TadA [Candidatus Aenigmarchaeota archaeon]
MVCDYENIEGIIKVSCKGCVFGSSIEDFDVCMARTIDKIREIKKVERIILTERREHEYDYEQTKLLIEIANLYDELLNEDRILESQFLAEIEKLIPNVRKELELILKEMLRRDPIAAYVQIKRLIRRYKPKAERSRGRVRESYENYIRLLAQIKEKLEKTKLIQLVKDQIYGYKLGDRSLYRKIFTPLIRPIFMLTRYMSTPPKGSRLIDKYKLPENISVEIFRVPGKVRHFYYITPPEFKLPDKKYLIIDAARNFLAEHKPTETEFIQPERAREIFMNMGKDTILKISNERGLNLSSNELNEMANILARYTAGFGILEVLLADPKLQDIYINSPIGINPIFIGHDDFEECETNLIPTKEDAESWATRFRMLSGRPLDEANPVLDTELIVPGGRARVAAITRTLSPEGIGYALRRHRDKPWTYPLFLNVKMFDPLFAGLMNFLVQGSRSLLIAGGRSSGKSSLLGATMLEIMRKFRIVTVEDTLELPINQLRNLGYNIERMKSRSVITRVESELPADEALRTALRLGDSCLIIGEVRSKEAQALWEAMRIGALAHVVAGTIHGESAYGVFDRVVNDLGVPTTSFKATDVIVICGMIRSADGLHRKRRVVEVTEVRKHWKEDPMDENGFVNLMEYSAKEDKLKPTSTLINGESYIINEIAKRVKEWHGNWDAVWDNILLRGKIKERMLEYANKLKRKEILEADWIVAANDMFHMSSEDVKREVGSLDSELIFKKWDNWFKEQLKQK